jgi:hypothetical protein
MASYAELKSLEADSGLLNRVESAVWHLVSNIAAEATSAPNHAARVGWAKEALQDSRGMAARCLRVMLGSNTSTGQSAILAASDAAILSALSGSVTILAGITA